MAIASGHKENFNTLRRAFRRERGVMECQLAATGRR